MTEMTSAGRELIRCGKEVTFRALAARMDLTPSALYRYVDSAADLNALIADAIFASVVDEMTAACSAYGQNDPAAQIVAAATAFRCWALNNVAEFRLVFTTTALSVAAPSDREMPSSGVVLFNRLFGAIFLRLVRDRQFPVPIREDLDDEYVATRAGLSDPEPEAMADCPENPIGRVWLFELGWIQLLGVVAVEAFGHVSPRLVRSGTFFMAQMREIGERSGMREDWDRLTDVSRAVFDGHNGGLLLAPARSE